MNPRLLSFFLILSSISCYSPKSMNKGLKALDEITIYSLSQYSRSLISVKCGDIKNWENCVIRKIKDKSDLREFSSIFQDESNFVADSTVRNLYSRILIECQSKCEIVKTYCWSNVKRISIDGEIFSYTKKVEDYLLCKKLILVIKDNTKPSEIDSTTLGSPTGTQKK